MSLFQFQQRVVYQLRKCVFSYSGRVLTCSRKRFSSSEKTTPNDQEESQERLPHYPTEDWIGPVDLKSNLHNVRFAQPHNETKTEEWYRQLREETHAWNQQFWCKQNEKFVQAKQCFTDKTFTLKGQSMTNDDGTKRILTPEELAEFYTDFLEESRDIFRTYNREWYRRNIYMLWPAVCTVVVRACRRLRLHTNQKL